MAGLIRIDELPWELRINGILLRSVQIRCVFHSPEDCELCITHPTLGPFSLHDGFELEIRDQASPWHPVTLEQLKKGLMGEIEFLHAEDMPKVSETAERQLFDRLDDIDIPHRSLPCLSNLTGHIDCVRQVRKVLRKAQVPHAIAGTVFVVPSALKARLCLRAAGFRKSPIAPAALIEPQTGCAVQLIERRI